MMRSRKGLVAGERRLERRFEDVKFGERESLGLLKKGFWKEGGTMGLFLIEDMMVVLGGWRVCLFGESVWYNRMEEEEWCCWIQQQER